MDVGTFARIQVRVERGRIVAARFKVFGCSAAIAATGLVAEWLEGASLAEAGLVTRGAGRAAPPTAPGTRPRRGRGG